MKVIYSILESEQYLDDIEGVIFDLDDTLYSEKDYVRSGYSKIADFLAIPSAAQKLWRYFEQRKPAIDLYLSEIGKNDLKEECLSVYRNQVPDIQLYDGVSEMLARLKQRGKKLGIITDGRVEGQQNKITALGLSSLTDDIIITDALGGAEFRKPNQAAFQIMQERWQIPFQKMIYIGDNPLKDFIAPKKLFMNCLFFRNPDGIYIGHAS